jgi:hypothetical protein
MIGQSDFGRKLIKVGNAQKYYKDMKERLGEFYLLIALID